jgi:hypothetical protein
MIDFRKILIALALVAPQVSAQEECPSSTVVSLGNGGSVAPCIEQTIDIPVYMNNPCAVGGFEIRIRPSDLSRFRFDASNESTADRVGGRITNWELFLHNIDADNPYELVVFGIADLPGGQPSVELPPGDGLLFTAHLNCVIVTASDTDLYVTISVASVVDTTGYIIYDANLLGNFVHVQPSACDGNPRGDCNCDGNRNGIDVIYLVGFFKGATAEICGGCGGDANSSGTVNGVDVTFLIAYLKGIGAEPGPCG